jgi:hypothetical protein
LTFYFLFFFGPCPFWSFLSSYFSFFSFQLSSSFSLFLFLFLLLAQPESFLFWFHFAAPAGLEMDGGVEAQWRRNDGVDWLLVAVAGQQQRRLVFEFLGSDGIFGSTAQETRGSLISWRRRGEREIAGAGLGGEAWRRWVGRFRS